MDLHTVKCESCGYMVTCTEEQNCQEMTCPTCGIKMKCNECGE